jgi:SAM-dependent methyltransferase
VSVFDLYARYYDLLYRDKDYAGESRFVADKLRAYAPKQAAVLELGCGTGGHAIELARLGYDVSGVDFSEAMLNEANRRRDTLAPPLSGRLRFAYGDVRDARIEGRFAAVISLFHVVSYQQTNDDLARTLATAAAHLPAGGVFLFDFWYGPAVLTQRPETRVKELEDEAVRITRIARSRVRDNEDLVEVQYRILVEEKDSGRMRWLDETHVMRYLFLPEIDAFLASAGMRRVEAKAWQSDEPPSTQSWSAVVVAQKTSD